MDWTKSGGVSIHSNWTSGFTLLLRLLGEKSAENWTKGSVENDDGPEGDDACLRRGKEKKTKRENEKRKEREKDVETRKTENTGSATPGG